MNLFEQTWNRPSTETIEYKDQWRAGGLGYGFATHCTIGVGKIRKAVDSDLKTRILLVGTRLGTVVVAERNIAGVGLKYNANFHLKFPTSLRESLGVLAPLTPNMLLPIFGSEDGAILNVGLMLEDIFDFEIRHQAICEALENTFDNATIQGLYDPTYV